MICLKRALAINRSTASGSSKSANLAKYFSRSETNLMVESALPRLSRFNNKFIILPSCLYRSTVLCGRSLAWSRTSACHADDPGSNLGDRTTRSAHTQTTIDDNARHFPRRAFAILGGDCPTSVNSLHYRDFDASLKYRKTNQLQNMGNCYHPKVRACIRSA